MALEAGIVGLPGAGKTTLFTALTRAGGGEYGKTHVGMAEIADPRLDALAAVVSAKQGDPGDDPRLRTFPGPGRRCSATSARSTPCSSCSTASRPGADPAADLENLKLELLVADRDHVAGRLERVEKQAKSGDPKLRAEVERLREVLAAVEAGHVARRPGGRAARRARAADDEAVARASRTARPGSTSRSRPSSPSCPRRRRPPSATAAPRRSRRSSAGSATRST